MFFKHKSCNSYDSLSFIQDLLIMIKQSEVLVKYHTTLHFEQAIAHAQFELYHHANGGLAPLIRIPQRIATWYLHHCCPFLFHSCVARQALT